MDIKSVPAGIIRFRAQQMFSGMAILSRQPHLPLIGALLKTTSCGKVLPASTAPVPGGSGYPPMWRQYGERQPEPLLELWQRRHPNIRRRPCERIERPLHQGLSGHRQGRRLHRARPPQSRLFRLRPAHGPVIRRKKDRRPSE